MTVDRRVDDWTWCDFDWEGNRGWVYANYLLYDVDNRRAPIIDDGPRLGLTVIVFNVNDYWGKVLVTSAVVSRARDMAEPPDAAAPPATHRSATTATIATTTARGPSDPARAMHPDRNESVRLA